MCDAPLGHIQIDIPGTMKDYDENISPTFIRENENSIDNSMEK